MFYCSDDPQSFQYIYCIIEDKSENNHLGVKNENGRKLQQVTFFSLYSLKTVLEKLKTVSNSHKITEKLESSGK